LSRKYGSLGWRQGPGKFTKHAETCPHCDVTFRKPKIEKEKKILACSSRLAESVEGLNSSLAQSAGESWRCKLLKNCKKVAHPVSSEISDLCEISDLLLFFSYFASQYKEIKSGNYFSDACCVN